MYKVMIVDDDPTSLAIGKALLSGEYEVLTMKSGVQALGYLKEYNKPDLILMDMVMPSKSGQEVLKILQQDPKLCDIPVIFLTSMEGRNFELECLQLGAVDYLQKPVNAELMKIKVRRYIQMVEIKRQNEFLKGKLFELKTRVNKMFDVALAALDDKKDK